MKSGATWTNPSGFGQVYEVALSDADALAHFDEALWRGLTLRQRWLWLSSEADVLVLTQMKLMGAVSHEYAEKRLAKLQAAKEKAVKGE